MSEITNTKRISGDDNVITLGELREFVDQLINAPEDAEITLEYGFLTAEWPEV